MKKLLFILLGFITLSCSAQTVNNPPAGSVPYGSTLHLTPTGNVLGGTTAKKYRTLALKWYVDSLLALMPPFDPSLYYTKTVSDARFVSLTGSYANPSWITSLAYSKITGAPGTPNLQSITNGAGNNLTTNIIGVTGESNLPSDFTGTALGHRITGEISSGITKYNEGTGIGGVNLEDERSELFFGSSSLSLRTEDGTTAGAYINKRLQISNGINSQDAVTMNQLTAAAGTLQSVTTGVDNNVTTNSVHIAGENNYNSESDGLSLSALIDGTTSTSFLENRKGALERDRTIISIVNSTTGISGNGQIHFYIGGSDNAKRTLTLYDNTSGSLDGEVAVFTGKVKGFDATETDQFTTLGQVNALIPIASSYIQNQNAVVQTPGNFNISGNGQANSFRALDNFSVGGAIASDINMQVNKAMSSTSSRAIEVSSTIGSGVSIARMFNATPTVSSSASLVNLHTFEANDATINAGGSVSNQRGFVGLLTSGTGKYNLYLSGTAANHLNGNTLVGTLTDNGAKLQVNGKATVSTAPTNPTDVVRLTDLSGYATTASLAGYVDLTNNQTVGGLKTFTSSIFLTGGASFSSFSSTPGNYPRGDYSAGILQLRQDANKSSSLSYTGLYFNDTTFEQQYTLPSSLSANGVINFPTGNGTLALTSDLANYVNTTGNQTGILGDKGWSGDQTIASGKNIIFAGGSSGLRGASGITLSGNADGSNAWAIVAGNGVLSSPGGKMFFTRFNQVVWQSATTSNAKSLTASDRTFNANYTFDLPDASGMLNVFNTSTAPSTSSSTGSTGEIRVSGGYMYICIATDSWVRAAVATF